MSSPFELKQGQGRVAQLPIHPPQGRHLGQDPPLCRARRNEPNALLGFVPSVLNRWCQRLLFPATAAVMLEMQEQDAGGEMGRRKRQKGAL